MGPVMIAFIRAFSEPKVCISDGRTYLPGGEQQYVPLKIREFIPPVADDVHPFVVAQVRHDMSTRRLRLVTQLVHPFVQLDSVITPVIIPKSVVHANYRRGAHLSMISPV